MPALSDPPYQYSHLTGAATTTVRTGKTILARIVVNTAPTTATVYDNTAGSGTVIAVIGAITGTFTYEVECQIGLTIVTVGASTDITVTYKPE